MACGCGKTTPPVSTSTPATPAQPTPTQPLDSEPQLVGAGK